MEDTETQEPSGIKPLSEEQLKLVRMARARDQFYHAETYRGEKTPLETEIFEYGKGVGMNVRSSDLIGWDEEKGHFTVGHDTENRRRARGSRLPVVRGRGSYCILDNNNTGEGIFVLTFDSPNDKDFAMQHTDAISNDLTYTFYKYGRENLRTVVFLGDRQISIPGVTDIT